MTRPGIRISIKTRAAIVKALRRNPNSFAVGKKFKGVVSADTVRQIARQLGMPPLRIIKFREKEWAEIAEALRQNPNCKAIARAHGDVSAQTVRTIAAEYHISLLSGRPPK